MEDLLPLYHSCMNNKSEHILIFFCYVETRVLKCTDNVNVGEKVE